MARKQTRGSVSLNRGIFEATKREADRRGQTLAAFVEAALVAAGVPAVEHPQQSLDQARSNTRARRRRVQTRANAAVTSPSFARKLLGDDAANAAGIA